MDILYAILRKGTNEVIKVSISKPINVGEDYYVYEFNTDSNFERLIDDELKIQELKEKNNVLENALENVCSDWQKNNGVYFDKTSKQIAEIYIQQEYEKIEKK